MLLCYQALSSFLFSQEIKPSGERFKLNNSSIHSLYHSEDNFVWIATDMGISRFDGFRFHNYPLSYAANSTSIPTIQAVNGIDKYQDRFLLLQLRQGGIACFDFREERYLPVKFTGNSFDKRKITCIYLADNDLLYIGATTGMYCAEVKYISEEGVCEVEISLSKPLLTGNISKITGNDKGKLFFCLNSKLVLQYSMGTQQTREFKFENENEDTNISTIFLSGKYLFVFPTQGVPVCHDISGNEKRMLTGLSDFHVTDMDEADNQTFYLSSSEGIISLKFESIELTKSTYTLHHLSDEPEKTTVSWDRSKGVLWSGSRGEGLKKIKLAKTCGKKNISFGTAITGMAEDDKGYIWLATEKEGIWKSTSPTLSPNLSFEYWEIENSLKEARCLYKDKKGKLWIGYKDSRIIFIDPLSSESYRIKLNPDNRNDFRANVESICLDEQDRLWAITSEGLVLSDRKSGNCSLIVKNSPDTGLTIYSVSVDSDNNIWLGTSSGLKRLNMLPGKIELTGEYEKSAGWEPTDAYLVYANNANQIFASYAGMTIRVHSNGNHEPAIYNLQDNLRSGKVICMANDKDGSIWIGCTSGIAMQRSQQNTIYNVYSGEACENICSLRNGQMLWANSKGLFYFSSVGEANRNKKLVLSDIYSNGEILNSERKIDNQWVINQGANLCFYFSDIHFDGTQQSIAYRLLPYKEWQSGILEDGISYSKLPAGEYSLQVKLIYPDGSEGDILEIPVVSKSSAWQIAQKYIPYVLLVITAFIAIYIFISKRRKKNTSIQPIHSTESTDQLIIQGRFMQELRTPLSVIVDLLKEFIQNKGDVSNASSKLLVAYRNSVGLRRACDQMLDIRSQMNMDKSLNIAPYSLSKIIDLFLFSVNELLHVYTVEFDYKKEESDMEVWVDKDKIMFLLRNLLANAFIRIRYRGKITLSVSKVLEKGNVYCLVTINDDGKYIVKAPEEITESELEENDSIIVCLGLEVMNDIVARHHGSLTIKSDLEHGTTATLKLATEKEFFSNDPNIKFVSPEVLDKPDFSVDHLLNLNIDKSDEDILIIPDENRVEKKDRDKPTILIVEDNIDILLYLKVLFESEYNVLQAVNGVEGVKIAQAELPDLIISDIMMPLKDGYQCCKEIKEGLDTCHIPFIMLTAKIEDEDVVKGLEVGADDYILKPFKPNILKAKVKSLIQLRSNLKQTYTELLKPSPQMQDSSAVEVAPNVEDPFIGNVIKIIEENLQQEDFSVKKLASELNMSQPTLYRKVKQYTDFTIIELIRGVRLRRAATLLQTKRYPVQEVAEMIGYNDIPTFRKHFVDMFGTTPSTYASSDKNNKE